MEESTASPYTVHCNSNSYFPLHPRLYPHGSICQMARFSSSAGRRPAQRHSIPHKENQRSAVTVHHWIISKINLGSKSTKTFKVKVLVRDILTVLVIWGSSWLFGTPRSIGIEMRTYRERDSISPPGILGIFGPWQGASTCLQRHAIIAWIGAAPSSIKASTRLTLRV